MGLCLFKFELLKSRVVALFVAGTSRIFLICFGVNYWLAFLYELLRSYSYLRFLGRNLVIIIKHMVEVLGKVFTT
jgi:hypothetical protein